MLKEILSLIKWFFSELIIRLVLIAFIAAGLTLYYQYREGRREQQPLYVKGIITDRYEGDQKYNRGRPFFQYKFRVSNKTYTGSANRSLCHDCKDISCVVGDSVLIEYKKGNPENNVPVCYR
jgi:hypothetical protein